MKKITNTAKNPNTDWLFGGNPKAIKSQEAKGQEEFVNSQQLPLKCNSPIGTDAMIQYGKMGIKVLGWGKKDELFGSFQLPEGWKRESTDHPMWNSLTDNKGRKRASIFYKGAFYDRDSFVNFYHRYLVTKEYLEKKKEEKTYTSFYQVKDRITEEVLFKTETTTEYYDGKLESQCHDFLAKNFPDYENLNAYWD